MKVLIFGINSFTGIHLSKYLIKQGFNVFGTTNQSPTDFSDSMIQCDISNPIQVRAVIQQVAPEYVINLAGFSFVARSDEFAFYKINALAVENILQACLDAEQQPRKIILVSSSTVYGNQGVSELSEGLIPKPENHYGLSKFMMENIANWYSDKLNIIVTRPFNYTGIGQNINFLIPKIIDHYQRKVTVIELGNLTVYREFNDIEFICDAYCQFLLSAVTSGTFNICTGKGYCIDDILTMMTRLTGHHIKVQVNPKFVRKNEIEYLVGSTKKLKANIQTLPEISLNDTLEKMMLKSKLECVEK